MLATNFLVFDSILAFSADYCYTVLTMLILPTAVVTSPQPTSSIPVSITGEPSLQPRENLFTWGYVSGDPNSPLVCPAGFTVFPGISSRMCNTEAPEFINGWIMCENDVTSANHYYECWTYPNTYSLFTTFHNTLVCNSSAPSCVTYFAVPSLAQSIPSTIYAAQSGIPCDGSLACGTSGGTQLVLLSALTPGAATSSSLGSKDVSTTEALTGTSRPISFPTTAKPSLSSLSPTSTTSTDSSGSGDNQTRSSEKTQIVLAIVGAVIGIITAVPSISFIVKVVKKKRKNRLAGDSEASPDSHSDVRTGTNSGIELPRWGISAGL